MRARPSLLALAAAVLAVASLSGCLQSVFGETRSDWAYQMTQLDDAAKLGRTGKGVVVAILDTGIDVHHPALAHLLDGDRGNGELIGFHDFLGNATTVQQAFDDDGHGTHVAGILAAVGGSKGLGGIDLRGGAPDVLLLVGRVCAGDACAPDQLPAAIDWAVGEGARVISMSLGGQGGLATTLQDQPLQNSVDNALAKGVVLIAAAGNNGPNNGDVESPAVFPGVIAVGAVDRAGQVAPFSNRGDDAGNPCRPVTLPFPVPGASSRCPPDQKPELVAPGVDILSSWAVATKQGNCAGQDYCSAQGTSQATPFVTAAVALMLEGHRSLSSSSDVEALKQVLERTARKVPGQAQPHDPAAGYGLVQARDAVQAFDGS